MTVTVFLVIPGLHATFLPLVKINLRFIHYSFAKVIPKDKNILGRMLLAINVIDVICDRLLQKVYSCQGPKAGCQPSLTFAKYN